MKSNECKVGTFFDNLHKVLSIIQKKKKLSFVYEQKVVRKESNHFRILMMYADQIIHLNDFYSNISKSTGDALCIAVENEFLQ